MELSGVDDALEEASRVLERAREAGTPVIHIAHDAGVGSLYDVQGESGAIAAQVAPRGEEPTVIKNYPNSFAQTDLHDRLQALDIKKLIVVGFMTHMCVSSTVRGGFDLGYQSTIVGKATATRDLPCSDGSVIDARTLRAASLSGIADLLAGVAETVDDLSD